MTRTAAGRVGPALLAALLAAVTLAGCSDDAARAPVDEPTSAAADPDADPADPADPDADPAAPPAIDLATEAPAGFPTDAVPLVEGTVRYGAQQDGVLGVAVQTEEDADAAYASAAALLRDAGLVEQGTEDLDGVVTGGFADATWTVRLTAVTDEVSGGALVTYTVSAA